MVFFTAVILARIGRRPDVRLARTMDSVEEHRSQATSSLRFAVLTASDSRRQAEDESGGRIGEMATAAGHRVMARQVVADEITAIHAAVHGALSEGAEVVVVTGGSGFARRDVSVEAVQPLLDRVIEGFGELFRMLSYRQVGAAAMLSRAVAGVAGSSVVFVLPGSPKAVELAMRELILPEAAHLLSQIRR